MITVNKAVLARMSACFDSNGTQVELGNDDQYLIHTEIVDSERYHDFTRGRRDMLEDDRVSYIISSFTVLPLGCFTAYQLYVLYGSKIKVPAAILLSSSAFSAAIHIVNDLKWTAEEISFSESMQNAGLAILVQSIGIILAWGICGWQTKEPWLLLKTLIVVVLMFPVLAFNSATTFAAYFLFIEGQSWFMQIILKVRSPFVYTFNAANSNSLSSSILVADVRHVGREGIHPLLTSNVCDVTFEGQPKIHVASCVHSLHPNPVFGTLLTILVHKHVGHCRGGGCTPLPGAG